MDKSILESIGEWLAYGIIISLAFFKTFSFLFDKIKLFFEKDKNKNKDKDSITVNVNQSSPHKITPKDMQEDYRYFLYFLLEQGKILSAMHNMRIDILREQMEYFNRHLQNIKVSINNIIIELLKDAGIDDIHFGTYFANFENFTEVCEGKITVLFRSMCKENHFSEYSTSEYRDLSNRNIKILEGSIKDLLRRRYPQKEFIKNFDRIYETHPLIRSGLLDCFEYARDIAIEKETKVKCAKQNFENQVSDLIGMKYSLEI